MVFESCMGCALDFCAGPSRCKVLCANLLPRPEIVNLAASGSLETMQVRLSCSSKDRSDSCTPKGQIAHVATRSREACRRSAVRAGRKAHVDTRGSRVPVSGRWVSTTCYKVRQLQMVGKGKWERAWLPMWPSL
eukprot:93719-Hanusia_phi.AAC.1